MDAVPEHGAGPPGWLNPAAITLDADSSSLDRNGRPFPSTTPLPLNAWKELLTGPSNFRVLCIWGN